MRRNMHIEWRQIREELKKKDEEIDLLIVDGTFFKPYFYIDNENHLVSNKIIRYETVKNCDQTFISCGAASIIAKVERDAIIDKLCDDHPEYEHYGWKQNRGYGTLQHRNQIKTVNDITPFHRKSFQPMKDLLKKKLSK